MGGARGWGWKPTFSKKGTTDGRKPPKGQFSLNSRGRFLLKRQEGTAPEMIVIGGLQGKKALEVTEGQEWEFLYTMTLGFFHLSCF